MAKKLIRNTEDPHCRYNQWCEDHPCPACDGFAEGCEHCDGTGVDPNAEYSGANEPDKGKR